VFVRSEDQQPTTGDQPPTSDHRPRFGLARRWFWIASQLLLALAILWQSARLAVRPDPHDELRQVDSMFVAGRYHEALGSALDLTSRAPRFAPGWSRLGMLRAIRGERDWASQALGYAIGLGLQGGDFDLVRLYQGRVATLEGHRDEAAQFWAMIGERSPFYPMRRVLEAEALLAAQDYAGAEAAYRAAQLAGLPAEWQRLAQTRLAALRATSDPAGALAELARLSAPAAQAQLPRLDGPAQPLLPRASPDAGRLASALHAPAAERAQLLGQIYLDAGWYALAESQFVAVAPDSPGALAAATYAAYTRWRAGARDQGRRQLETLVAEHPDEPRARALLALAYLADRDEAGAQAQLNTVRALAPRAPDTHLAWAQWYAARHDYVAAAAEYRRAYDDALPDERGRYALELARFHIDTSLRTCEVGLPAAEESTRFLPAAADAWTALASARLSCDNPAGARAAAQQALELAPGDAEASFYLGRALAQLGARIEARQALIAAADLAPSSAWRERAENQLATLGL
jgi:Flp pilus assembly protein TadD